jgi:glycosyltransferase involved in cell wall biosynthesis
MRDAGYSIANVGGESKVDFFKKFYRYFKANKFDVVHIHTEKLYFWKVMLLRLTGHKNIVRTFHNCWTFEGMLRNTRIVQRRMAKLLGAKHHAIGDAVSANERKMFRNECYQINNWIMTNAELIKNKDAIRAKKRTELGIPADDFVIVSVGGCSKVKNHGFILDLVKVLNNQGQRVTYLHVGSGLDEETEKAQAKDLGVGARVVFTGNRKDVPELLVSSDVYMMPSLFEGLSIALLEAMYYNGLVVVNDAPGLNNMIDNSRTGFVVNIENKQDYVDLLVKLIENRGDVSAIRSAARNFIGEKFSMEKNAAELIKYYKLNTKFN